jgi:hypothetical protein
VKIEDYALIGDLRTSALVGRNGSIDWLCLPRTDSPACFAALLGNEENGRWLLCPSAPVRRVTRRYREGTLILETDFETDTGTARVIDFMPLRDGGAPRRVHLALLDHRDRRRTTRKRGSVPGLLVLARHGTRDEQARRRGARTVRAPAVARQRRGAVLGGVRRRPPAAGRKLPPQAFTHLTLVAAAKTLANPTADVSARYVDPQPAGSGNH